jgi:hypothetical protein
VSLVRRVAGGKRAEPTKRVPKRHLEPLEGARGTTFKRFIPLRRSPLDFYLFKSSSMCVIASARRFPPCSNTQQSRTSTPPKILTVRETFRAYQLDELLIVKCKRQTNVVLQMRASSNPRHKLHHPNPAQPRKPNNECGLTTKPK